MDFPRGAHRSSQDVRVDCFDAADTALQLVKSGPVEGSFQNYILYLLAITSAKKSIWITNQYFIPDDRMIAALLKGTARGVRVIVLVPGAQRF